MSADILGILRILQKELCPDGLASLQIGGIGNLEPTPEGEARITFIQGNLHQYVTLTDDEWDDEGLIGEVVELMKNQREQVAINGKS